MKVRTKHTGKYGIKLGSYWLDQGKMGGWGPKSVAYADEEDVVLKFFKRFVESKWPTAKVLPL